MRATAIWAITIVVSQMLIMSNILPCACANDPVPGEFVLVAFVLPMGVVECMRMLRIRSVVVVAAFAVWVASMFVVCFGRETLLEMAELILL